MSLWGTNYYRICQTRCYYSLLPPRIIDNIFAALGSCLTKERKSSFFCCRCMVVVTFRTAAIAFIQAVSSVCTLGTKNTLSVCMVLCVTARKCHILLKCCNFPQATYGCILQMYAVVVYNESNLAICLEIPQVPVL